MAGGGANSLKSILYALVANALIAVAKGIAAAITGSGAMLAEAIHSTADSGNQLLLLWGMKQSRTKPTEDHPLGFGKAVYFWSFVVAVVLFSMGGLFSIYEGVHKFMHPEPLQSPQWAIGVLGFAIFAEGFSLWGALREVKKVRYGRSLVRWFAESRQSELLVVVGEDFAALLGLVFALAAVGLSMLTGNPIYDAIGTMFIGVLLIVVAYFIAVEVKALLIGQSVEPRVRTEMRTFLDEQNEVAEVYSLLTLQMGNDVMVAVKARMKPVEAANDLIDVVNVTEAAFREKFPQVMWLFFEPDNKD
jgi:cation diffusion facilitator family transporter